MGPVTALGRWNVSLAVGAPSDRGIRAEGRPPATCVPSLIKLAVALALLPVLSAQSRRAVDTLRRANVFTAFPSFFWPTVLRKDDIMEKAYELNSAFSNLL